MNGQGKVFNSVGRRQDPLYFFPVFQRCFLFIPARPTVMNSSALFGIELGWVRPCFFCVAFHISVYYLFSVFALITIFIRPADTRKFGSVCPIDFPDLEATDSVSVIAYRFIVAVAFDLNQSVQKCFLLRRILQRPKK